MPQRDLNREIASATGDSMATISRLDFVPLTLGPVEREPLVLDWDEVDQHRCAAVAQQRSRTALV